MLCAEGVSAGTYSYVVVISQLMSSNRMGAAKSAYREVQERHEDIKRIEKTLTELAQLFNDVSGLGRSHLVITDRGCCNYR